MKTRIMILLSGATFLLLVSACGGEEELTKVKLALDWYPNANHVGLYIAQEKGYFAEENLEVEMYTPVDPSTVLQTVGAGSDDFGINYQTDLLLARGQGVPVISIAAIVQHPLNIVMTLTASGITRPSELVGKKVGYPGIPANEPLLDTMLKADGASGLEAVELVNVGWDLVPALIGGTVDACIGCYISHETIMAENEGYPVNILRMEEWGVPDFYELVLVTSEAKLAEDPDLIERFVRAVVRGYKDAMADPQAAVDTLLIGTNEEVDEAIERPGVGFLSPLWGDEVPSFGWQTQERWASYAAWMYETGQLREPVDPDAAFTNEFVEAAR
ncbi:MAG: ABC transporter substrate-binding protein [Dehalococcoidia bacterium]